MTLNRNEFRQDPLIGRWIFIAPSRMERPSDFRQGGRKAEECPFCEGNERMTPPEKEALRSGESSPNGKGWRVRVVPNMYPVTVPMDTSAEKAADTLKKDNILKVAPPRGIHEIIIETPEHNTSIDQLPQEHIADIFRICKSRITKAKEIKEIVYVLIFRNQGPYSGASLVHPHTQVLATTVIPRPIEEKLVKFREDFTNRGKCTMCSVVENELLSEERIIEISDKFVSFAPFASRFPFEITIVPKEHNAGFEEIDDVTLVDLAGHFQRVVSALNEVLRDISWNMVIFNSPVNYEESVKSYFHWHIEILPRFSRSSGFEWGNGFFVNPILPEKAALVLRKTMNGRKPLDTFLRF